MKFSIRALSGQEIKIETEKVVQEDGKERETTVRDLKQIYEEKQGVAVQQIRFLNKGAILLDDQTLDGAGITEGCTLSCVYALRAGGKEFE